MTGLKLGRLALCAAMSIATFAAPASAASLITDAFMANVKPNVAFLEQSSKLALGRSTSAPVLAYAQTGAADATRLAEAVSNVVPTAEASLNTEMLTGRSVAIDGETGLGQAANGRKPRGDKDLANLTALSGRKFLDAYWLDQLDALSQLRADYEKYAEDGDDPALVAMAKRELPAVEHRLALLSKI